MELALSLGVDTPKPFLFLEKSSSSSSSSSSPLHEKINKDVVFYMGLGKRNEDEICKRNENQEIKGSPNPFLHLDLLPFSQVTRNKPSHFHFPWLNKNSLGKPGLTNGPAGEVMERNRRQLAAQEAEEGAGLSSPNSGISTFEVKLIGKRDHSDEEADASARKKLRLTKEQSAFLEDSFKEHSTLNTKQKAALAKQLNLRPRQVEVWFQNRRARTKLKQTEVDCDYLKKCCETLTEENKKLHKEIQELRALKSSQHFYKQLPATTLTMCPSCERTHVANSAATATATADVAAADTALSLAKPFQSPQAAS